MNRDQAKQLLLAYRPDSTDADDPEIAAALAFTDGDPELKCWLEVQQKTQAQHRTVLAEIEVPRNLRDEILEAHSTFVEAKKQRI